MWYNKDMEKEKTLREQLNKTHAELQEILRKKLLKNRKLFVGKYFSTYIDDGKNRYQYIYIDNFLDGDIYGWWFTIGDGFTEEYSIVSEPLIILDFVADDSIQAPFMTSQYDEITKDEFWKHFQYIVDCMEQRKLSKEQEKK